MCGTRKITPELCVFYYMRYNKTELHFDLLGCRFEEAFLVNVSIALSIGTFLRRFVLYCTLSFMSNIFVVVLTRVTGCK